MPMCPDGVRTGEEVGGEGWPAGEGWTFDHFYGWWSAPDEQPPASPAPAYSPDHPNLAALRAKLRCRSRTHAHARTRTRSASKMGRAGRSTTCVRCFGWWRRPAKRLRRNTPRHPPVRRLSNQLLTSPRKPTNPTIRQGQGEGQRGGRPRGRGS